MEIGNLLAERDIVLGMRANGKRSAFAKMAASLADRVGRTQGDVQAAMADRERLGSTGIGRGVAIPHGQMEGLRVPAGMLAMLQHPIAYGSPDGAQVDVLLALLWPRAEIASFLPALAHFSRLLRRPELLERLRASERVPEAYSWLKLFEGGSTVQIRREANQ